VVHKNTLKVAIFSESRLGMTNNIYIQNQLVQIYKMLSIFGIFCNFLKIQFLGLHSAVELAMGGLGDQNIPI